MYEQDKAQKEAIVTLIDYVESNEVKPVFNYDLPVGEPELGVRYSLKYIYGVMVPNMKNYMDIQEVYSCLDDWGLVSVADLQKVFGR